jgi:2'-5' RNA ligase
MVTNFEYSLWVMPSGKDFLKLNSLVEEFANKYKSDKFIPHISLVDSIFESKNMIDEKMKKIIMSKESFTIHINKITFFDEKPGGLYFLVKNNSHLNILIDDIKRDISYTEKAYKIPPHLTISYAKLSKENRIDFIKDFNGQFTIKIKNLYLVDTSGKPSEWKVIKKYKLK